MVGRRAISMTFAAIAALATAAPAALAAPAGLPDREADPVVLVGADVPQLEGADPGSVVAFEWEGEWRQIPVQVDERAVVDYPTVRQNHQTSGRPFTHEAYTDAGTFAGADPDPTLDDGDEIALMAKDAGLDATDVGSPAGVVPSTRTQVAVSDPLDPGVERFVYLFETDSGLDPAAGRTYVDYDFKLDSGDYKTTYSFSGVPGGDSGNPTGGPGNPEDSTVDTGYYHQHIGSRWIHDGLQVKGGTGVDILDGDKDQVSYGCGRSELTFSRGGGGFIANRSGPVRAIRSYIGANSGTYTQQDRIYYERSEVTHTDLRVHPGINVISQFLDYSPAASGMTYRSSADPAGVTIDGVPDPALETGNSLGPPVQWEQVTGPQGTLSIVNRYTTDISGLALGSYYQDDSTSPTTQQCGGYADDQAWGASGSVISMPAVSGGINTDPTLGTAYSFAGTRTIFYGTGGDAALAALRSEQVDSPLTVAASAQREPVPPKLKLHAASKRVRPGGSVRIPVRVENTGGTAATGLEICGRVPKSLARTGPCKQAKSVAAGGTFRTKVKVSAKRRARGRIQVTYRATADNAPGARIQAKVAIRR
ncbi:MAG: hypothetical protein U0R51_00715 [Solirubrobacterales bacterium]